MHFCNLHFLKSDSNETLFIRNSPQDLHQIEEDEPAANLNQIQGIKKRKLSETEDSLIYNRKRMTKENQMWGFTQEMVDEDPLLKTFRYSCQFVIHV